MELLNLTEEQQFKQDLDTSRNGRMTDFENIKTLSDTCILCADKLIEIIRRQEGKFQHVVLCGKCHLTYYRWGV